MSRPHFMTGPGDGGRAGAAVLAGALAAVVSGGAVSAMAQDAGDWPVHSMDRPRPPVVEPAPMAGPVPPPSDAIVLFDGTGLDEWRGTEGGPAGWRVVDGAMEVVQGAGSIATARGFGSCRLHVEWRAPAPPTGDGQDRGNSGVYLMARYEVQVLDSYRNDTYPDGQAAAIYGQYPPLVNASRAPGEWQSYDIVFRAPRFAADGSVERPARVTVFHNGVLVHDAVELMGPTGHRSRPPYEAHADRLPILLQDHGDPVRYRNIWIRDLEREGRE